jgi:hypothetical protein
MKALVQSNKGTGYVWVILDGESQSSVAELEAAVSAAKGAKAEVTEAFTDIEIDIYGIEPGVYYAYATDQDNNLSEKSANSITVTDGIAPIVTAAIQGVENGDDDFVLAQSNEPGVIYIILDGENAENANDLYSAKIANKGASAEVSAVDTDVEISTKDLIPGIYYAYAVDEAGNVSEKGTYPINITQTTTSSADTEFANVKVFSASRRVIIECSDEIPSRAIMYDATGRRVHEIGIEHYRSEFMVSHQGIYFVELISSEMKTRTYKIVVQ